VQAVQAWAWGAPIGSRRVQTLQVATPVEAANPAKNGRAPPNRPLATLSDLGRANLGPA
jgi:hypothetical protein